MKKTLALLLCAAMLLALCACGQSAAPAAAAPEATPEPTPEPPSIDELIEQGRAYYYGLDGQNEDPDKATELFQQAAERGSGLAYWYLGNLYTNAEDEGEEDAENTLDADAPAAQLSPAQIKALEKALEAYRKASAHGCPLGLLGEGKACEYGVAEGGVDRARELYEQALAEGCAEANYELGRLAVNYEKDGAKGQEYLNAALESEELFYLRRSCAGLGYLYLSGESGAQKDPDRTVELYERAAGLGDAGCWYRLGRMFLDGDGVTADNARAKEYFEKGVEAGEAECMVYLGNMYWNGKGVEEDHLTASDYYEMGAEAGSLTGMCQLGSMYYYGQVYGRNVITATEWYGEAAEKGAPIGWFAQQGNKSRNMAAAYTAGTMLAKGVGVDKSVEDALDWFNYIIDNWEIIQVVGFAEMTAADSELYNMCYDRVYEMYEAGDASLPLIKSKLSKYSYSTMIQYWTDKGYTFEE
ncbi:MAG: sel1 repeat family protein [Oscillospiraceae bacterium]|nr:sel1 repeat family protein [Oscillospiraceae bacterium]